MEQKDLNSASLPEDGHEQLRLLMESVRDYATLLTDTSGRIVRWTPGVRSIFGYEEAEFVGQNVALIFTPEDREQGQPEREMREAALHGRAEDERWHLKKDGSRFFASGSLTALRNKDGALCGYSKILRDTTERHRQQEEEKRRFQELRYLTTRARALLWHGTVWDTGLGPGAYAWDLRVFDEEAARAFFPLEVLPGERYTDAWYRQRLPEGRALTDRLSHEAFGENRGSYHAEFGCKSREGEVCWFSEEVYVEPLAPGQWRVVGVALDITERRHGEEALQASEERFRLLVEGVREYAVVMLDPEGNIATWNSGAGRIMGISAGEVLGRHFSLFYTPEDRERGIPERLLREAREQGRFETEGERVRQDGSHLWVSTAITALRDEAGNLRGYSIVSRDITDKKRAEEKLAELAAIVASSEDAIIGKTLEGVITSWNAGAQRLYGYEASEVIGRPISLLMPPDYANDLPQILGRVRQGERVEHYETMRRRKDGSTVHVSLTVSPVKDAAGRITGASAIARNITERKLLEAERAAQSERNRHIAETLQRSMLVAPEPGAFPGLEVETLYEPALNEAAVGGDFFDAFSAGGNRVVLVVGDVSGKGLAAAQRTSQVKYALRAFVQEYPFPARALGRLNQLLYNTLNEEKRVTFVAVSLAVVDTENGQATFALAGAEPPLLLRADGAAEMLAAGGLPLGIDPATNYQAEAVEMGPGDTILMITDGITEARAPDGAFLEGEGLIRLAREARPAPTLREMGDTILDGAKAFAAGSLRDDVCLLLARWGQS